MSKQARFTGRGKRPGADLPARLDGGPRGVEPPSAPSFRRRGLLAAGVGALAGAFVNGKGEVALAASGGGDQGVLNLGSNPLFVAPNTYSNTAAVSSVATLVQASVNFGNFIGVSPDYVFGADARPATGDIVGLHGYGSGYGYGVAGTAETNGYGVVGTGGFIGTFGSGVAYGAYGQSTSGNGVYGTSAAGIGGQFSGGSAALRLAPDVGAVPPDTGTHSVGEFVVSFAGKLFFCTVAGTPGTWVELTAPPAAPVTPTPAVPSFKTLPTPERFVDTRINLGGVQGSLAGATTSTFQMTGRNGQSANPALQVPDSAVTLVGNLTVLGGPNISVGSFVTVWPGGPLPTVSNINVGPGGVVANSFVVGMTANGGHGFVSVYNAQQCDYILDVTGYYS